MSTLIPLGPGLASLGTGNIDLLAQTLTIAFNTTIVGIVQELCAMLFLKSEEVGMKKTFLI